MATRKTETAEECLEDPERARVIKGTRFLLRRRADTLSGEQRDLLQGLAKTNEPSTAAGSMSISCGPSTGRPTRPRRP